MLTITKHLMQLTIFERDQKKWYFYVYFDTAVGFDVERWLSHIAGLPHLLNLTKSHRPGGYIDLCSQLQADAEVYYGLSLSVATVIL